MRSSRHFDRLRFPLSGRLRFAFVSDEEEQRWAGKAAYPSLDAALDDLGAIVGERLIENFSATDGQANLNGPGTQAPWSSERPVGSASQKASG